MTTYDVYMILCGDVAKATNDYEEKRQAKLKGQPSIDSIPGITVEKR